jgi:hypothetical protein
VPFQLFYHTVIIIGVINVTCRRFTCEQCGLIQVPRFRWICLEVSFFLTFISYHCTLKSKLRPAGRNQRVPECLKIQGAAVPRSKNRPQGIKRKNEKTEERQNGRTGKISTAGRCEAYCTSQREGLCEAYCASRREGLCEAYCVSRREGLCEAYCVSRREGLCEAYCVSRCVDQYAVLCTGQ